MSIANTKALVNALDKTIYKTYMDKYAEVPTEYDKLFTGENAPKGSSYVESEITGLGPMREISEGRGVEFDTPEEGHKVSRTYVEYGLGFQVTKKMLQDDLTGNAVKMSGALAKSARYSTEVLAFTPFNSGFTTAYAGWDALALFSNSHVTLKGGATINNLGAADLSSTSFQAAWQYFDDLVDETGMPIHIRPTTLLIATASRWVANDLLKQTNRVWDYSSENTGVVAATASAVASPAGAPLNRFNPSNGAVDDWKIFVSRYLTDSDAWFLLGDGADLRILWKQKATMESDSDFHTGNRMYKNTMRLMVVVNDYKALYGNPGA